MSMFKHKGFNININTSGLFTATVNDVEVSEPTLQAAQAAIDRLTKGTKETVALAICGIMSCGPNGRKVQSVQSGTLIGLNRTTRDLQFTETPKDGDWSHILPDSPGNHKLLQDYINAQEVLTTLRGEVEKRRIGIKGYGRINPAEYATILAELKTQHEAKAKL
jgi:hypothetical protein